MPIQRFGPRPAARTRAVLSSLALLGAVATLTACGSQTPAPPGSTTTAATTSTAPTTSPTGTATSAAPVPSATETDAGTPFPATAGTATADPSTGAKLTVTGVRVAAHDGFDRVVFDLGGTGSPGWRVSYVDKAVDDPSGLPVQVQGGGILQVVISGTGYPTDTGQTEWSGGPLRPGLPVIQEVQLRGVFEGQTQAFVGVVRAGAPFRVFALTDPARLVLDVQD